VNEAFAKKFNLGANPVGRRMAKGRDASKPLDMEIVGLVRDSKYSTVKGEVPPLFITPYRQELEVGAIIFYVRTSGEPGALMQSVPQVIKTFDPNIPVVALTTMSQQVRENTFMDRMITTLSAAFAVVATLLTAVGLYGVLAFTVAQRTREFGVRMALGAEGRQVRWLVLRQVSRMTAVGTVIGVGAAIAAGRAAQSLLFELEGHDPVVVAGAIIVLACVAMAAGYVPAWRASRVEPMRALRDA
jgi:ABC-type antimicrobial peptide transport system permease subunit